MNMSDALSTRLIAIRYLAAGTLSFEFARPDGAPLPDAAPGAHIGVHLPNGQIRQYSLVHAGSGLTSYEIAVKLDAKSRGGSRCMHESLRVGSVLRIDAPRNNFPLTGDAAHSLFLAGGIGITPIVSMMEQLAGAGRPFNLHYAVRNRDELAYLPLIETLCQPSIHVDTEQAGRFLDVAATVAAAPADAHLYCCGPGPMLAAFEATTATRAPENVHVEYFTPREQAASGGDYTVTLAKSGRELHVPAGARLLQVLRDAGVPVESSCEEGVCASCETRVLDGVPDHRDSVLSTQERASGRTMMVCVSGCLGSRLVLDL